MVAGSYLDKKCSLHVALAGEGFDQLIHGWVLLVGKGTKFFFFNKKNNFIATEVGNINGHKSMHRTTHLCANCGINVQNYATQHAKGCKTLRRNFFEKILWANLIIFL